MAGSESGVMSGDMRQLDRLLCSRLEKADSPEHSSTPEIVNRVEAGLWKGVLRVLRSAGGDSVPGVEASDSRGGGAGGGRRLSAMVRVAVEGVAEEEEAEEAGRRERCWAGWGEEGSV
mmetsp:Transcript_4056/g.9768  ORF Transcript_4056/g.9768 Transcript_4056/m.9768 type:complete len:118 (-) Transcript_4056:684-1037(-)